MEGIIAHDDAKTGAIMILSRGRRYIFIHIPKTGGTSLARALEGRAMADDIMLGDTPKALKRRHRVKDVQAAGRLWKHSTLADLPGLATHEEIARFRVFTLVRNPWDRMVSYYHWLKVQSFAHPAVQIARERSFSEFLASPEIARSISSASYGSYVTYPQGQLRCDLFLRLEHLAEDIPRLEDLLDIRLEEISHDNKSLRDPDYRSYYSEQDRDRVAEIAAEDIVRFGYRF